MTLLFSQPTAHDLAQAVKTASHAWLLEGPDGYGKVTTARYLAAQLLAIDETALANYPYLLEVAHADKAIGIEEVRTIQRFMSRKTTGQGKIRRIVIVSDCHTMTIEAQNAFLKLLEEPPTDTVIILTIEPGYHLLPTVDSRVQKLRLTAPTVEQLRTYFMSQGYSKSAVDTALAITRGRIGLMTHILHEETTGLTDGIDKAKAFLKATAYQRLCQLDSYSTNREELHTFLQGLHRVTEAGLHTAAQKGQTTQTAHWHRIMQATHQAQALEATTPNVKLLLLNLSLEV